MKPWTVWLVPVAILASGCKSDLGQQLLERELRYQEDQIYQLQDELQDKCTRLDRTVAENVSLRRQLGVGESDPAAGPRSLAPRSRPGGASSPVAVPPATEIPGAAPLRNGAPTILAPPVLDDVPPLPAKGGAAAPPAVPARPVADGVLDLPPPAGAGLDGSAPAADVGAESPFPGTRLSYETVETVGEPVGPATHVVVNPGRTACLDADGDGTSEGLVVVFEPRDAGERLVSAPGDVTIIVHEAGAGTAGAEPAALAQWQVPAAEAVRHFRGATRARGMQFSLPWPAAPPATGHVRVTVRLSPPGAQPFEADATIPVR